MKFKTAFFLLICFPVFILLVNDAKSFQNRMKLQTIVKSKDGFWETEGTERDDDGFVTEESNWRPQIRHWLIKGDTLWILRYPNQFYEKRIFQIRSDSIFFNGSTVYSAIVKFKNDSMDILWRGGKTNHFKRADYSPALIETLKRDTFNFETVIGKYQRIKHFTPGDEAEYDAISPVPMPSEIFIGNSSTAKNVLQKNIISLPVHGKSKQFIVERFEWDDYDWDEEGMNSNWEGRKCFEISPGPWWKGEPFSVLYVEEKK
jgi:hypothetical protein